MVTRDEALKALDDVRTYIESGTPPIPDPAPDVKLIVTAAPGEASVKVDWAVTFTGKVLTGFAVGRDGVDNTGAGPWVTIVPANARTLTFDKLVPGTEYTFTVTANFDDNTIKQGTTKGTPKAPTVPPTPSTRLIPHPGKSGLPFPSLIFKGNGDRTTMIDAGQARGRAYDGVMFFATRNGGWGPMKSLPPGAIQTLQEGRLVVIRIPHAPENLGPGINNAGAADSYAAEQKAIGSWLRDVGANVPNLILSVDWEMNGDWYAWSIKNGTVATFKQANQNFAKNVIAGGADKVNFDFCPNKGPSQSGADFAAFPGAPWKSITVDHYDWYGPMRNDAEYLQEQLRVPSFKTTRDEARKRGVMWGLSEGGSCHAPAGAGDNPAYWMYIKKFFFDPLNSVDISYHVTYDDAGAPNTLHHDFASNPNSWAYYRTTFGNAPIAQALFDMHPKDIPVYKLEHISAIRKAWLHREPGVDPKYLTESDIRDLDSHATYITRNLVG